MKKGQQNILVSATNDHDDITEMLSAQPTRRQVPQLISLQQSSLAMKNMRVNQFHVFYHVLGRFTVVSCPKNVYGFWSLCVALDPHIGIYSFLVFAMKRCPITAKIAGLLPYCVLNDFFTYGCEHLPNLCGLSIATILCVENLVWFQQPHNTVLVSSISLVGKKGKRDFEADL